MHGSRRSSRTPTDRVAGSRAWRPSLGYLAVALGVVASGVTYAAYWWTSSRTPAPDEVSARASLPIAASSASPTAPVHDAAAPGSPAPAAPVRMASAANEVTRDDQQISRERDPDGDQTPDISDFVNSGERPTMAEVIGRLHQAGVHSGLGAFSPPGTRPPLVGLAVPEEFVLPEGYVRHYQATDDGQRIEPILMFSPDQPVFDASGRPIEVPKDRVVPPELAPPGLPVRRIVIPAPAEPGRPGS